MEALRRRYRGALPQRIQALETARDDLPRDQGPALETIKRIAHSLRGSGGTHGFPEITEAAGAVEDSPPGEVPGRILALIEILHGIVNRTEERPLALVVEDDPTLQLTLKDTLASRGCEVVGALTIAAARRVLEQARPALILLDLQLPDGDGRDLLLEIREQARHALTPVLVLTSKTSEQTRNECLALGASAFFEKPVSLEIIARAAGEALSLEAAPAIQERAQLRAALARAARDPSRPTSVALVAFDDDGALASPGDAALHSLAKLLEGTLGTGAVAATWGDAVLALLPGASIGVTSALLQAAASALRASPMTLAGGRLGSGLSYGVAPLLPNTPLESLAQAAERGLSAARAANRERLLEPGPPRPRVLVADDDQEMGELLAEELARDCEVVFVHDGAAALSAAAKGVSLCILDVDMPLIDGFELLTRIRCIPTLENVPIVMVTAMGKPENVAHAFELGADEYIVKPFSVVEAMARIRRFLRRGEGTGPHTRPGTLRPSAHAADRTPPRTARVDRPLELVPTEIGPLDPQSAKTSPAPISSADVFPAQAGSPSPAQPSPNLTSPASSPLRAQGSGPTLRPDTRRVARPGSGAPPSDGRTPVPLASNSSTPSEAGRVPTPPTQDAIRQATPAKDTRRVARPEAVRTQPPGSDTRRAARPAPEPRPIPEPGPGESGKTATPLPQATQDERIATKMAPRDTGLVGKRLDDKYEVLEEIGRGGMGAVYKARHVLLGSTVALKVVSPQLADQPIIRERFLREARAAMVFSHPNAITVRECGTTREGLLYMTQDFSPGTSLRAILTQEKRLPVARAVALVRGCLDALREAHAHGVVHRDLKPENVMVESVPGGERPRICDFGVAKVVTEGAGDLTAGFIVGSPAYMSPEQATGGRVDARSDLYSVGCILYELLTGKRVFPGRTFADLLLRHMEEIPSLPSTHVPVSAELDALVLRVLSKSPDARPASAQELLDLLNGLSEDESGERPVETSEMSAHRESAAARQAPVEESGRHPGEHTVTLAPDASRAFAIVVNMGSSDLSVFRVQQRGRLELVGKMPCLEEPKALAVHPQGRFAYVVHEVSGKITAFALNPTSGNLTRAGLLEIPDATAIAVRSCGRLAFVATTSGISTVALDPQTGKPELTGQHMPVGSGLRALSIHPSGRFLYVTSRGQSEIVAFSVGPGGALTPAGRVGVEVGPRAIAMDPAGRFLLVASFAGSAVSSFRIHPSTGALERAGPAHATPEEPAGLALTPDGTHALIVCAKPRRLLVLRVGATGELSPAGPPMALDISPCAVAVDPLGEHAYVVAHRANAVWVYRLEPGSGKLQRIGMGNTGTTPYAIALVQVG